MSAFDANHLTMIQTCAAIATELVAFQRVASATHASNSILVDFLPTVLAKHNLPLIL